MAEIEYQNRAVIISKSVSFSSKGISTSPSIWSVLERADRVLAKQSFLECAQWRVTPQLAQLANGIF